MSDTETTVDDVTTDVDTDIDTTDDSTANEISYEQALEWKKKAERLEKAEKTLVELKRKAKELEKSEPKDDVMTKADYAKMRFLEANPELNEYTKDWEEKVKKGYTFEDAMLSVLNSDTAKKNREKLNSIGLSDWETTTKKSTITKAELAKIAEKDQNEYNRIRNLMEKGDIKLR